MTGGTLKTAMLIRVCFSCQGFAKCLIFRTLFPDMRKRSKLKKMTLKQINKQNLNTRGNYNLFIIERICYILNPQLDQNISGKMKSICMKMITNQIMRLNILWETRHRKHFIPEINSRNVPTFNRKMTLTKLLLEP